MRRYKKLFFIGATLCIVLAAHADSFLVPEKFPKTFKDVEFMDQVAVMAEGYGVYDRQYDENGNCISGCPYAGITIEQDQKDVDEATDEYATVLEEILDEDNFFESDEDHFDEFMDTEENTNNVYEPGTNQIVIAPGVTPSSIPRGSPLMTQKSIQIISDFGFRLTSASGFHGGVDIPIKKGTPVFATGDGIVYNCDSDYNGPCIKIKHDKGFWSWYLHLSKKYVSPGDKVRRGQRIALSGSAGKRSTGAHLDYRISLRNNGRDMWVDVLCPCRATYKNNAKTYDASTTSKANVTLQGFYDPCNSHSAFWRNRYYSFYGKAKSYNANWRVKANHCMRTVHDKLPDEK